MTWVAFGPALPPTPGTTADALAPRWELRGGSPATRPVELLSPPELASVQAERKPVEVSAHVADHGLVGFLGVTATHETLDQAIAEVSRELDSLRAVRVSTAVEQAYLAAREAHSKRAFEVATTLRVAGRASAAAVHAVDPSLIVVHHQQGDASSQIVIPPAEFPELYSERAKLQRFEEVSGIDANRKRSMKQMQLTTLLDARAREAGNTSAQVHYSRSRGGG